MSTESISAYIIGRKAAVFLALVKEPIPPVRSPESRGDSRVAFQKAAKRELMLPCMSRRGSRTQVTACVGCFAV